MRTDSMETADFLFELGKHHFFNHEADPEKRQEGIQLILKAFRMNHPEAAYLVARFLLDGIISVKSEDNESAALNIMNSAANRGCIQARAHLNKYCQDRYNKQYSGKFSKDAQPKNTQAGLVGFDGKPIKVDRTGVFTPVDAKLTNEDGKNILTLSVNIKLSCFTDGFDEAKIENAICDGLMAWQGEYEVFGGQQLSVRVVVTKEDRTFDNVFFVLLDNELNESMLHVADAIGSRKNKERAADVLLGKRSFAQAGLKWSVNTRKVIYLQSRNGRFDDYDNIMNVTKHEFGHALGLGDLYQSSVDSLQGVAHGMFAELDCYEITDKYYNLVMCDHNGPISNNDIEMVVLAFSENKMQLFQKQSIGGEISYALGRGN